MGRMKDLYIKAEDQLEEQLGRKPTPRQLQLRCECMMADLIEEAEIRQEIAMENMRAAAVLRGEYAIEH